MDDERFLIRATNDRDDVLFYEQDDRNRSSWTDKGFSTTKMTRDRALFLINAWAQGGRFGREAMAGLTGTVTFDIVERVYLASHSQTIHFAAPEYA